jgi:hypothetical protein
MDALVAVLGRLVSALTAFANTPIGQGIGVLLGAYLVYWFGLRAYFAQKEYENVRDRYLAQGFDVAIANVEYALGVHRANWMLMLRHLKLCRDTDGPYHSDELVSGFVELDHQKFQVTPVHRIGRLLEADDLWGFYQLVFAFVGTKNDFIRADFGATLRMMDTAPQMYEKSEFVQKADALAQEMNEEAKQFYLFLHELHSLAHIFERERYTRKSVAEYAKRKDVQEVLAGMRSRMAVRNAA